MTPSSFLFFFNRKKKKYRPLYIFYRNISGSVFIESVFVIPIIFFLFGSIFLLSMMYIKYRSMDIVAEDIAHRFLYKKIVIRNNITNISQLKREVCKASYIMLKCSNLKFYIDAYEHGKFNTINLSSIFSGSTLVGEWTKKNDVIVSSPDYFKDNSDSIFVVRIGYPGVKYVGVSITQGQ